MIGLVAGSEMPRAISAKLGGWVMAGGGASCALARGKANAEVRIRRADRVAAAGTMREAGGLARMDMTAALAFVLGTF
jgi:hypothetical protein